MGILLTQFLTCSARCQLAWRLNSLVTWQIGSKSSPSLSCGRIRGPQIPKSLSFARLILFPAPPLDPAILSSLGFVDLGGRLNGRMLRKTLNPLNLQKTPGAEERTGAKSPTFLNAQASGVLLAPFSGGLSPRGDLFSFSQASPNPRGGCPDGRGLAQRSVDGLDSRRIIDAEGAVALVTESSGFRSHHDSTEGLKLFFKRDNKGIPLKPPLSDSRFPMTQFVTSDAKIPILRPFVEDWLGRNILTKSRLPPRLFLSRLFYAKKKNGKFRPILDLSRLNIFVQTPSFAME